ncbi:MAG: antitoxin Xre/MbcA/ParS toxin-binding domain-containing protein [Cyclobacteriaceae bacterium]
MSKQSKDLPKKRRASGKSNSSLPNMVEEPIFGYISCATDPVQVFKIKRAGKESTLRSSAGYGHFIPSITKSRNLMQVAEAIENGLSYKEITAIIDYFEYTIPEIARAASVSSSTVSRWSPTSSIGIPGSNQFYKMDQITRKGLELFGSLQALKSWLQQPCLALGNAIPAKMAISQVGIEMVEEALDAMHFGNVM